MIAIRSYIPSLLTFPGVVLRQVIHAGFCRLLNVKILDIRFFRRDTPSGYVLHEMPKRFESSFLLILGPLFVHSLLCFVVCIPALVPFEFYGESVGVREFFQLWLGLSIGMHAFPPRRDAGNLWNLTRKEVSEHGAIVRLMFPLLGFLRMAERLTLYGFDVAYAAVIGIGIPWLVLDLIYPKI